MSAQKNIVITALLLMLFAMIGAALVGVTHDNTKQQILHNEKLTLLKKLNTILPESMYDNDMLTDTVILKRDWLLGIKQDATAYIARKQNRPVAIVLPAIAPNGYNGPIHLLVGIRYDNTLAGVRVIKHRETPGLGDVVEERKSDWILGFNNRSLIDPTSKDWKVKRDGGIFDQFTGATITPRAIVKAIHSALIYFRKHKNELFKFHQNKPDDIKPDV